jgi:hypothetical protein
MKLTAIILRCLSGLLLLFAGAVKLNDPAAYAIKLSEYFNKIKQDASVRQDTLLISLHDGIKTLKVTPFRLYADETNKTLIIQQELQVKTPKVLVDSSAAADSTVKTRKARKFKRSKKKLSQPKSTYLVNVGVFFDGNPAGDTMIVFKDSGTATLLSVQAKIRNQSAFQKSFKVMATASAPEQNSSLNLESYIKPENRTYGFFSAAEQKRTGIAFVISFLELMLGFALLFGWGKKFTLGLNLFVTCILFSLSLFAFNHGTFSDTGAFGQGIIMPSLPTLIKDAALLGISITLIILHLYFTPLFSRKNGLRVMLSLTVLAAVFGSYCYCMLPVWDVSPFKPGSVLKYKTSAKATSVNDEKVAYADNSKNKGMQNRASEKTIAPADEAFGLFDPKQKKDVTDIFLKGKGYKWMLIIPRIENTYTGSSEKMKALFNTAQKEKIPFVVVTASSEMKADAFVKERRWPLYMLSANRDLLDRMAGFNPTLYLINGNRVVKKWSGLYIPQASYLASLKAK